MKPLSIVAYFDGRLGHEKQTRAILNALSDMTSIHVESIEVSVTPATYFKNLAAYFFSFLVPARPISKAHSVDLFIGTGTHTHIPMILDKKSRSRLSDHQMRVVTCMSPDPFLRNAFDLCFIPMHDESPSRENVFVTQGPPSPVMFENRHNPARGLILVGGLDTKSHVWKSEEIAEQIRIIIDKKPDMLWTVSSSPRTPEETCSELENMAASIQQLSFYRSKDTPAGWVEEQYALNETVWVTADSISMVYEALTAGCSVGVLQVEWLRQDNKFEKSLQFLTAKEVIVDFTAWQKGASMPTMKDKKLNESSRCAQEILSRWWKDRIQ
jgi:mitochondrial fission protein ELM1